MLDWPEACPECTRIYHTGYNQYWQAIKAAAKIAA
jgi:hypothetical protein